MGSYVSVMECRTQYNVSIDCTIQGQNHTVDGSNRTVVEAPFTSIGGYPRQHFPGDPDIAGVGILAVFVAVTSFATSAGLASVLWQMAKTWRWISTYTKEQRTGRGGQTSVSDILETLVLACCTISAYHYNIVANMMLLTCATHLISVTIVRNYWKFPWLALLRVICISGVFIVTGLLMTNQNARTDLTFPTVIPDANETDSSLLLPAACFQSAENAALDTFQEVTSNAHTFLDNLANSTPRNKVQGLNLYIITLLFYGAAIIAEFIRFVRRGRSRPGWRANLSNRFKLSCGIRTLLRKVAQNVFLFYLLAGVGISCAVVIISAEYIFGLRRWVDRSGWIELENNKNLENDATSFGQLVPIFSSALILFSFFQLMSEKCTRRNNHRHDGEDLPVQAGTIHYFDPSSYDDVPPPVPEKDKAGCSGGIKISTANLPPRIGLEHQSSWGSDMNFGHAQLATPLLSENCHNSAVARATQRPDDADSYAASPLQPGSSSTPPLLPLPLRPQSQTRNVPSDPAAQETPGINSTDSTTNTLAGPGQST
ncbi:hypothetical protein GGR54DRAFT_633950 [Hypoxylon sp. NC1633]|nr:hypothetical protein GGR54DRAFT_633950 [Hypoxylon sp. NC1633]